MNSIARRTLRSLLIAAGCILSVLVAMAFVGVPAGGCGGHLARGWVSLLGILAAAGGVCWFVRRRGRLSGRAMGRFLPRSAPRPSWAGRLTGAIVLAAAGGAVLTLAATHRSTGGVMLMLDEIRPELARVHETAFLLTSAGVIVGAVVALLWRTWAGVVVTLAALCGYGWLLNGPDDLVRSLAGPEADRPVVTYRIGLADDLAGAELWVNGVHLGKTPYLTTMDEFLRKVPYWPEPPKGYRDGTDEIRIPSYGPRGQGASIHQRWIRFEPPKYVKRYDRPGPPTWSRDRRDYYARVKLDGQWGGGHGGGGGGGGGRYRHTYSTTLSVVFPQRDERIGVLLTKARLADYRVAADWFQAMAGYGRPGWKALRKAAMDEQPLAAIVDDWARWQYGLDSVRNADDAWRVLETICAEADRRGRYDSASPAGRAVELLIDRLDPDRLVDHALKMLSQRRRYAQTGHGYRRRYGRMQIEARTSMFSTRDHEPVRAFVFVHAVWMLDQSLDRSGGDGPNLVERRVTGALIRASRGWAKSSELTAAMHLGGPDVERYLLRQRWRIRVGPGYQGRFRDTRFMGGIRINGWLYNLATLPGPAGREFRSKHAHELIELADQITTTPMGRHEDPPGFLFMDVDLGPDSLAMRYWPKYRARAAGRVHDSLKKQWEYLARMGPAAGVEMFLDAWRKSTVDYSWRQEALTALDSLPADRRNAVAAALVDDVNTNPAVPARWIGGVKQWRLFMLGSLDRRLGDNALLVEKILAELEAETDEKQLVDLALWLEHTRPDAALVNRLMGSPEPALRLLALSAVWGHPTAEHRQRIGELLTDPDPGVVAAAKAVREALKDLADEPPGKYAAGAPTSTTAPSPTGSG